MKSIKISLAAAGLAAITFTGIAVSQQKGPETNVFAHRMNPHDDAPTAGGTVSLSPIVNHHGPVMVTPTVYLIWYGNWAQNNGSDTAAGQELVNTFLGGLSGSPYLSINTSYGNQGTFVLGGSTTDPYSQSARLTDRKVQDIVTTAITSGRLPRDANGIYFVLTSTDVSENSGFCSRYCGWHTYGTISQTNIKYAFVGNANRCLSGCAAQTSSPNGNPGVDGMISVIAHELEEAISDPNLNAWYDASGAENADKCAWTFGSGLSVATNGSFYNMTFNLKNFLIQRNLSATDNKCYIAPGKQ